MDIEAQTKIREEIQNDPYLVGYAGKTDTDIVKLLNNPVIRVSLKEQEDYVEKYKLTETVGEYIKVYTREILSVETKTKEVAPINRILQGVAGAENKILEVDIINLNIQ